MNIFSTDLCKFKLSFELLYKDIKSFEDFLDFIADAVAFTEIDAQDIEASPEDRWLVEAFFTEYPKQIFIDQILYIAKESNIQEPSIIIYEVEDKDWVEEVQQKFTPFSIGRFTIASHFYENTIDTKSTNPIIINPSRAFGTGEHQTTKACILGMEALSKQGFDNILDLGTGTGILAIASSKIWPNAHITATDIDAVACEIAQENCNYNNARHIAVSQSEGFISITPENKFDLIIANILLRPLIEYAPQIYKNLSDTGYVILSGITTKQEDQLLSEFQKYNFVISERINLDDWIAIILQKTI